MKRLKQYLLWALALCCLTPALTAAAQAEGPKQYPVDTVDTLIAAVMEINQNGGEAETTLTSDITLDAAKWQKAHTDAGLDPGKNALCFSKGTVTILGDDHSITADVAQFKGITVSGSAVLNLGRQGYDKTLTVKGGGGSARLLSPLLSLNGSATLNMYDGVTVKDSYSLGTPAGIQLEDRAAFYMHGGVIENCNNGASVSGGVMVDDQALFCLCGGTIRSCKGYGGAVSISSQGRMEFKDGLIENCESYTIGGAIVLERSAVIGGSSGEVAPGLKMTGGAIKDCRALQYGGAICLYATNAKAELTGGSITGCEAAQYGGGVACLWGTLTVDGAAVYDNTAGGAGDDLFNYGAGTATIGAVPSGLTLTATGKPIDGWYEDGADEDAEGNSHRYQLDPTDPSQNYLVRKESVTNSTEQLALKAAHGPYYTVTYNLSGGTDPGTGIYDPISAAKGTAVTLPAAPDRDGYIFTGWSDGTDIFMAGSGIPVSADTTLTAQWLTVDEWISQRLNIYVDVQVDVVDNDDLNAQNRSASVDEAGQDWLHDQVRDWIRDILTGDMPGEIDRENAAALRTLITDTCADSVDVTLTVGVRYTGDPSEEEASLLTSHTAANETAQVWQLTVTLGAESKKGNEVFDWVGAFSISELDEPVAIRLTTGQNYSGRTVRVLYIHDGEVRTAASSVDQNSAAVTVQAREFSPYIILSKPTGGSGHHTIYYTLRYESGGGTAYPDERCSSGTVVTLNKVPVREGYTFTGWYAEPELTTKLERISMTKSRTVYAGWKETPVPGHLNSSDHFAYVYGYPDGTVGPMNNITRAEVSAIFFRLLRDEVREKYLSANSIFPDVKAGAWYVREVSTLHAMGILKGRDDGLFHPDDSITRAEFATICARFDQSEVSETALFPDIAGHWAEGYIQRAAALGWVRGYPDGSFGPDDPITRAEAVTMINRVLRRLPGSTDDLLPGMKTWPDNPESAWYYLAIQEATNGHDYTRRDGTEKWTALQNAAD